MANQILSEEMYFVPLMLIIRATFIKPKLYSFYLSNAYFPDRLFFFFLNTSLLKLWLWTVKYIENNNFQKLWRGRNDRKIMSIFCFCLIIDF